MKELPLEKQFQIMDLLRLRIPERDIARLIPVAKSTVQVYKKRGPPWFRKSSKTPSVESYPASILEENQVLRQTFQNVVQIAEQAINQRNTANKTVQYLTQSKDQKDREIERKKGEIVRLKQEKEQLSGQVSERDITIQNLTSEKKQLDQKIIKLESEDHRKNKYIKDMEKTLQQYQTELPQVRESLKISQKEIDEITRERDKYKLEAGILTMKQKNTWLKYGVVGAVGVTAGLAIDRWFLQPTSNSILSQINESVIKPILQSIRVTLQTPTSGNPNLRAAINNYKENTGFEYNAIPSQPSTEIPDIQEIVCDMTPKTTISGILCSGIYPSTYGNNTGTGDAVFPNHQDGLIQPEIQGTSGDITISTYTSGIPYSEVTESTHFIPREDVKLIYSSPPTPISYISLTPPDNPLDSPLMQQLLLTSGRQFEEYLQWFFIYQGCPTELTQASHDKGADLVAQMPFGRTVIEAKQRKDHVGIDAINAVNGARIEYNAPHAIVITTSKFTKEALEHANKLGVECWDGHRLLQELYKHQYFLPPK